MQLPPPETPFPTPHGIPGLKFRRFAGESDFPGMLEVILRATDADHIETSATLEGIAGSYRYLSNCDPFQDMIVAEMEGKIAGYSRGWWEDQPPEGRMYHFNGYVDPARRRQGIGGMILSWMEARLRQIASAHPPEIPKYLVPGGASHGAAGTIAMLEKAGYQPIRFFHNMIRPTLDGIPDLALPAGLELRPARPEHYRAIWASIHESAQDEWGHAPPTEAQYRAWLQHPHSQPDLWQIAWDIQAGVPVGHVLTFIDREENERYGRKRGYTEGIGVVRAWRRRGVARALVSRSLQAQKEAGMTESALVADSDSRSGVTAFYESCGFVTEYVDAIYRKAM